MKPMFHCAAAIGARRSGIVVKRVLIWTLGLTVAAFLALIAFAAIFLTFEFDSTGTSDERRAANVWLSNEIAQFTCLTPDNVRNIAAKKGWLVETHNDFPWIIDRTDLSGWMSIRVEPPLLFSNEDENRRYFGFDAQGCSQPWR